MIKVPTEAQMAKLPNFALDMIQTLKMRLDEARKEVALLKGDTPSLVNVESWDLETPNRPLGDRETISFSFPNKNNKVQIRLLRNREGIRISAYHGRLSIEPASSNVVEITTES